MDPKAKFVTNLLLRPLGGLYSTLAVFFFFARRPNQTTETKTTNKPHSQRAPKQHPPRSNVFFLVQGDAFHWGWQFVICDSRLHLSENVVGTLISGGSSLLFATQDCTLLKMPSLPVCFFLGEGGRRHRIKGHRETNAPRAWNS